MDQDRIIQGAVALVACVLVSGWIATYYADAVPVTLIVDGAARPVRTHQQTVGALLVDVGLSLRPEDIVEPAPETLLRPGMAVSVSRARAVTIQADGRTWTFWTHAPSADQVLAEAGISLHPADRVTVTSCAAATDLPTCSGDQVIRVARAVPVTLHENGRTLSFTTAAPTVGQALEELGLALYRADRVRPDLGEPVSAGMHIFLERSRPVTVQVDGKTIRTRTHRTQVGEVLADLGIILVGQDYTHPPPETPLGEETTVQVVRVAEAFLIQQSPIPYPVRWQPDPELEIDHRRLIQEGAPGILQRRWRVRYENGVEVARALEDEYVAVPPTEKIIGYGTKIVVRQLATPEGTIEYWRVIRMLATSYSASTAGVPRTHPYYGRTRLGLPMQRGIVAVDPRVIPLRTRVYVPGYGIGFAADTGGAIKGRRIDLGYNDDDLVLWYRWVDVYVLTPVPPPDQIPYILD
ncbi:MAG: ubiquitin-like domain-containing protein [Anaerolineae bacterium]|nr:ubiquitin-like domain-containing protein [Anaerolineae bacterium]